MPGPGWIPDASAARRLKKTTHYVEDTPRGVLDRRAAPAGQSAQVYPVKVTGAANGAGYYPGAWYDHDATLHQMVAGGGEAVWAFPHNGVALTNGTIYLGRSWGTYDDGTGPHPVYAVDDVGAAAGGGTIEAKDTNGNDFTGISILLFDSVAGLTVSQPVAGEAKVTLVPPFVGARVYNSAGGTTGIPSVVPYDTVRWDTSSFFSLAHATRLTAPVTGYYLVGSCVRFENRPTDTQFTHTLTINGTVNVASQTPLLRTADARCNSTVETVWKMTAGDYAEAALFQPLGGAVYDAQLSFSPEFWIALLGR